MADESELHESVDNEEAKSADFVELFFDLVYVFAITEVAGYLRHHLDGPGAARAGIVLFLLWWSWSQFTWMSSQVEYSSRGSRLTMLMATAITFFMASAVHDAWGDGGRWFGVTYLLMIVAALQKYSTAVKGRPELEQSVRADGAVAITGGVIVAFVPPERLNRREARAAGSFPTRSWVWRRSPPADAPACSSPGVRRRTLARRRGSVHRRQGQR